MSTLATKMASRFLISKTLALNANFCDPALFKNISLALPDLEILPFSRTKTLLQSL